MVFMQGHASARKRSRRESVRLAVSEDVTESATATGTAAAATPEKRCAQPIPQNGEPKGRAPVAANGMGACHQPAAAGTAAAAASCAAAATDSRHATPPSTPPQRIADVDASPARSSGKKLVSKSRPFWEIQEERRLQRELEQSVNALLSA